MPDETHRTATELRKVGRPFVKGPDSRRNRGGRPPLPPETKAAFETLLPRSVEVLQELLGTPGEPLQEPRLALEAAQTVQYRLLGKPETVLKVQQHEPVAPPVFIIRRMGEKPPEASVEQTQIPAGAIVARDFLGDGDANREEGR